MPVRVLNAEGEGSSARIAEGIRWAVNHGARVLNVSIELYDPVYFQAQSITAARRRSPPRCATRPAQGDRRRRGRQRLASATSPTRRSSRDVIYVGGTTEHGCLGDYSNYGRGMDLVAPGGGADANLATTPTAGRGEAAGPQHPAGHLPPGRPGALLVPDELQGHVDGRAARHRHGRADARGGDARQAPDARAGRARSLKRPRRDLGAPGRDATLRLGGSDATPARAPARHARAAALSARSSATISTEQGAWWLTLFGTEPSRKRSAPVMPLLPTTMRSAPVSSATSRIASAGLPWRAWTSASTPAARATADDVAQDRVHVLARRDRPLAPSGRHRPRAPPRAAAARGDRLVRADDLQPRAERAAPARPPPHGLARGVRPVRAHDDRVERRAIRSASTIAMTIAAERKTTISDLHPDPERRHARPSLLQRAG